MPTEKREDDWLEEHHGTSAANKANSGSALLFAQKYLVFEQDGRAKELLAHWDATILRRKIGDSATHSQYAAVREFIQGIKDQIVFANNRGNQPL
jgi:hypothetical protein